MDEARRADELERRHQAALRELDLGWARKRISELEGALRAFVEAPPFIRLDDGWYRCRLCGAESPATRREAFPHLAECLVVKGQVVLEREG